MITVSSVITNLYHITRNFLQVAVRRVLKGLLDNLQKCPQDKSSIYKCVQGVGDNNPNYVALLAPEMLRLALFCDQCDSTALELYFL